MQRFVLTMLLLLSPAYAIAGDEGEAQTAAAPTTRAPAPAHELQLGMTEAQIIEHLGRQPDNQDIAMIEIAGAQHELRSLIWWIGPEINIVLTVRILADTVIGLDLAAPDASPFLYQSAADPAKPGSPLQLPPLPSSGPHRHSRKVLVTFWGSAGSHTTPAFTVPDGLSWRYRWASYDPNSPSIGPAMHFELHKIHPETGAIRQLLDPGPQKGRSGIETGSFGTGTFEFKLYTQLPWILRIELVPIGPPGPRPGRP